jgi:hypothetical protein
MLEQAIVDASALREAAIQNAESAVVERFSGQIKEVVESLLQEQEEMPMEDPAMAADTGAEGASATSFGKDAPEDKDEIFSKKKGGVAQQTLEAYYPEVNDDAILEIDLATLKLDDIDFGRGTEKITVVAREDVPGLAEEKDKTAEEDVELSKEELEELAEAIAFDWKDAPDGGFANGQMKPAGAYEDKDEMVAAIAAAIKEHGLEVEEKLEKETKKNATLKKENIKFKRELRKLLEGKKELIDIVNKIKEKFDEVQLTNAKLHYTNRVLIDDSLNERQKSKIVESISVVSSIEQAKIVYETLQSTVGTLSDKKEPNSLNEVVSKRNSSSILLHSRQGAEEKKKVNNEFANRMRRLAGIN